jgi:hypothetical protein
VLCFAKTAGGATDVVARHSTPPRSLKGATSARSSPKVFSADWPLRRRA